MTAAQKNKRNRLLDYLKNYYTAGNFPANNDYPYERKPCFIDREGNICAVGYLVAQSAGREIAEEINSKFQYAAIYEMESDKLKSWIASSGFSKKEIAMIQPSYGAKDEFVGFGHGVPSFLLNASNITFSSLSLARWSNNGLNKNIPIAGLVSCITTLSYNTIYYYRHNASNRQTDAQRKVTSANLIFGVLATGINGFRLLNYSKKPEPKVSFNLNVHPGLNHQPSIGFVVNKKL